MLLINVFLVRDRIVQKNKDIGFEEIQNRVDYA